MNNTALFAIGGVVFGVPLGFLVNIFLSDTFIGDLTLVAKSLLYFFCMSAAGLGTVSFRSLFGGRKNGDE